MKRLRWHMAGAAARALTASLAVFAPALPTTAGPFDDPQEYAMVLALFERIQHRSFDLNVELCGYIVEDASGHLRITGPFVGEDSSCSAAWPAWGDPIASWHTHGAYSPDAFNELPSDTDVDADWEEEVDGWVATPGGRLWHVDGDARTVSLVCGRDCLPSDPEYDPETTGPIADFYDYDALLERFEE
ncbi:MAG: DUF4329 domain-containing protein [Pseudomonadota bacterium]